MNFRSIAVAAALLSCLSAPAWAKSPFDGSWRLDAKRSYWTDGKMPKNMSLVVNLKFQGDQLEYDSVNDTFKANPPHLIYKTSLDGKPTPLDNQGADARYDTVSVTRLDAHNLQLLKLKGDDVIVGEYWTFSEDGKHLVRKGVGKSKEGKSKGFVEYFERNPG